MTDLEKKIQNAVDEQQKKNEPARLETTPTAFPTHTQGYITDTISIARLISENLSVFGDYAGCRPYCFMGQPFPHEIAKTMTLGDLYVDLYFEKGAGDTTGFNNLELVGQNDDKRSEMDRLRSVCGGINNATTYKVNKDTLDMLSVFLPTYNPMGNSGNPLWNTRIIEELSTVGSYVNARSKVSVRIIGFSIDNFMSFIYGTNEPDDNKMDKNGKPFIRYDYHCIPLVNSMSRINSYGNTQPTGALDQEYVVQVLRNDRSIITAMQKSLGLNTAVGGGNYLPRTQ